MPAIADRVLEIWREYQAELAESGVSDRAKQLELDVWQAMQMAPGCRHVAGGEDPPACVREPATAPSYSVGCVSGSVFCGHGVDTEFPKGWKMVPTEGFEPPTY